MAKSPRKHTLCTPLSIDQLFIFGIFEHKWGTRKHIDDLKKFSWCIPVQKEIKPIIWGAAITPEPWNRQQCWFIFEDPNVRVARRQEIRLSMHRQSWRVPPYAFFTARLLHGSKLQFNFSVPIVKCKCQCVVERAPLSEPSLEISTNCGTILNNV